MSKLSDYLSQLNSGESNWGLYVDPDNPENNFRVGQMIFENGGLLDGYLFVGTLEDLTYAPCMCDCLETYLDENRIFDKDKAKIPYQERDIIVSISGIIKAYDDNKLEENFKAFLEDKADEIAIIWQEVEADFKAREIISQILGVEQCK